MILISTTSSSTSAQPNLHVLNSPNDTPSVVKLFSTSGLSLDIKDKSVDTARKPVFLTYKNNVYCLGQFAPNLVVVPEAFAYIMGIAGPSTAPTLTTSGTGITGTAIGYITFVRKHPTSGRELHESSPSPATAPLTLTNQGRQWTVLPTTTDLGITHLRGYVSMDGAEPRVAWEREIGTTSVIENTATLSLGKVLKFERDPPPYGAFGDIYHDRLWLVDPADATRLWFSEQFEPESFTPLNFINLLDGERITAVHKHGDILLVWSRTTTYALTGWSVDDFVFRKINPSVGCVSPYSVVDIHNKTWFASEEGVCSFDGSISNLMKDVSTVAWKEEMKTYPLGFQNCQALDDREFHVYKLQIATNLDGADPPYYWVGHYEKFEGELDGEYSQPDWVYDRRNRTDTCHGKIRDVSSARDSVYTGSSDGFVRKENVSTNFNDDGDTFNKKLKIQFKHYLMDDPGGDITEGKTFHRLWSYVESEGNTWTLKAFGGDEHAGGVLGVTPTPLWSDTVAASASAGKLPKTVHAHVPEKISGRGITIVIEASTPDNMVVRGFGGTYGPGPATRGTT